MNKKVIIIVTPRMTMKILNFFFFRLHNQVKYVFVRY